EVSWSAGGTHLAWIGDEVVSWDDDGWSTRGRVVNVGAVAVNDALTSTNFVVEKGSRGSDAVAVDDTGRVLYLGARRLWVFAEGAEGAVWNLADADGNGWTTATLTPDGS